MMIWSRLCCRWVPWRGTRAAWLRLPHAVIVSTAACVVCSGPMRALPVPAGDVAAPGHVRGAAPAWPPMGAFLPGYGGGFVAGGGGIPGGVYLVAGSTPWGTPGYPGTSGGPRRANVPEPGTATILAAAVGIVLTGRKWRRKS